MEQPAKDYPLLTGLHDGGIRAWTLGALHNHAPRLDLLLKCV